MTVDVNPRSQQYTGKKLKEIRERRNLSQEEVAKTSGISITYYAGIERGEENPTYAVLESICKTLKIKSSEILPF
jgi:transcriptional regulator with XRE-family HTH domain